MKNIQKIITDKKSIRIAIVLWGILLITLHFTRIFDNNFWGDEYYSIHLGNMSFAELINATAHDVHPPFYYLILKVFIIVFGNAGWVYHLASFVPFSIMIIASVTVVYDDFGSWTSFLLASLCGMLYPAIHLIVEVRDYQWAALWMFLSFIYYKRLVGFENNRNKFNKNTTLFTVFSLLAAYSHYFCIIALVVVYASLMIFALKNRSVLKPVLIIWGTTFLAYMPWCITFFLTLSSNTDKIFSTGSTSILACFEYIFDSKFSLVFLILLLCSSIYTIVFLKSDIQKIYTITGVLAALFTIMVPFVIEYFGAPILFLRNLYPVCPILWILFADNITRIRFKNILCIIVAILIVPFGLKAIINVKAEEKIVNEKLDEFLEKTSDIIPESNSIIVTNEYIISPGLAEYYYPGVPNYWYDGTLEKQELIKDNAMDTIWIIDAVNCANSDEMRAYCESLGYMSERIVVNGFFGNYIADVWKCYAER